MIVALIVVLRPTHAAAAAAPHPLASFRETARAPIGQTPVALAVGELSGDGHADVMVVNAESTATLLLGDGAGALPVQRFEFFPWDVTALALGDIDGDGVPDAVVSATTAGNVIAMRGDRDTRPEFGPTTTLHAPWSPGAVAVADMNGDGTGEIVVADLFFQAIVIARSNPDWTFDFVSQTPGFPDPVAIAFGDVNRDGIPDLGLADGSSHAGTVLLGDTHGALGARRDGPVTGRPAALAVGDLDRDGHDDLVVATRAPGGVAVLLGAADGSLRPAGGSVAAEDPSGIALGDFDLDGILDVAVAERSANEIRILHGSGRGTFDGVAGVATGAGPSALAVADMNGDGRADLVCANHDERTVQVFVNIAHPAGPLLLAPPAPNPVSTTCALSFVLAADAPVRVDIHDVRGALVRRLLPERLLPVGPHTVIWDGLTDGGRRARSGLYLARVRAGSAEATTRIVLGR